MFEDSLVDSGGRLKTKSKYWMIGTAVLNFCILAVMIIIPAGQPRGPAQILHDGDAHRAAPTPAASSTPAAPRRGRAPGHHPHRRH